VLTQLEDRTLLSVARAYIDTPAPGVTGLRTLFVTTDNADSNVTLSVQNGEVAKEYELQVLDADTLFATFALRDFDQIDVIGGAGNDHIVVDEHGGSLATKPVTMDGGAGNDTLIGGSEPDSLIGGPGDDLLRGMGGNDMLVGGPGRNTLDGGSGVDSMDIVPDLNRLQSSLDDALGKIQENVDKYAYAEPLPMISGALKTLGVSQVTSSFRTELADAVGQHPQLPDIQQLIYDVLGPDPVDLFGTGSTAGTGLNLLGDTNGDGTIDTGDVVVVTDDAGGTPSVSFQTLLHRDLLQATEPVDFQLAPALSGLPLSITTHGGVQVGAGFDFDLTYGLKLDPVNGPQFFLDTSTPDELKVKVQATIPNLHATGTLGILQANVQDDPSSPSVVEGSFAVDLQGDSKVVASFTGDAHVNLDLGLSFGDSTASPRLSSKFKLDWTFANADTSSSTPTFGGVPDIAFNDVALDLGSFVSDLVGPIVSKVQYITEPLQPLIVSLETPLPVLRDLAKRAKLPESNYTLLALYADYAKAQGYLDPAPFIHLIDAINQIKVSPSSDEVTINLGSFDVTDPRSNTADVKDASLPETADPFETAREHSSFFRSLPAQFQFPILEHPTSAFQLLLGQDVPIFKFDTGTVQAAFQAGLSFSVPSPFGVDLIVGIGGSVGLAARVSCTYDTAGIREYFNDPNHAVTDLLDGFYASSGTGSPNDNTPDTYLSLTGELNASVGVGVGTQILGFAAIVKGAVDADVTFRIRDPNGDGKVRWSEIETLLGQAQQLGLADFTMYVFNISAQVTGSLDILLTGTVAGIPYTLKDWNIASRVVLWDFPAGSADEPLSWDSPSGGAWEDPANWVDSNGIHRVPNRGENVVISPAGDNVTVTLSSAVTVRDMTCSAKLVLLSGATLKVEDAINGSGNLTLDGGEIQGGSIPSGMTVSDTSNGGTLDAVTLSGEINLSSPFSGPVVATTIIVLAGGTVVGGTLDMTGAKGLVVTSAGGTLEGLTLDGTLDLASYTTAVSVYGGLTLNGVALLGAADGSTYGLMYFRGSPAQTLSGTAEIRLGGNGVYDGLDPVPYYDASGNYVAPTLTLGPGVLVHGGSGTLDGPIVNQGEIAADAAGETITVGGQSLANDGVLEARAGGTLVVSAPIANLAQGVLAGGHWWVAGDSTLQGGFSGLSMNSADIVLDGDGSRFLRGDGTNALVTLSSNSADGQLTIQDGSNLTIPGAFDNAGNMVIGALSSFATSAYEQTSGTTALAGGRLVSPSISLDGGTLTGVGTIVGTLTNAAVVSPGDGVSAGRIRVEGGYAQTAAGSLDINLGGAAPGVSYDWLDVGLGATLDGTLNVAFRPGFVSTFGDTFTVLTFGSRSGAFATMKGLDGIAGPPLDANYDSTGLTFVPHFGPAVTGLTIPVPNPRNTPVAAAYLTFAGPIASRAIDPAYVSLTRNGPAVAVPGPLSLVLVSGTTYQLTDLSGLTGADGTYTLTIQGPGVRDGRRGPGQGSAMTSWLMDTHKPTSKVAALAASQTSLIFPVNVSGTDPGPAPGVAVSGISTFDVFVSTDGSAFVPWTTIAAVGPDGAGRFTATASFTAQSGHKYGFLVVAHDAAGNVESKPLVAEATTYVPDLTPPDTRVNSVDTSTSTFAVHYGGTDAGGSGLAAFTLYVQVDGATPRPFITLAAGVPDAHGVYSGTASYQATSDGQAHSYRFYTVGTDGAGNVEPAPAGANDDVTVTATFAPQALKATSLVVQHGSVGRSFVRYVDLGFNQTGAPLQNLIAQHRLRVVQHPLSGPGTNDPVVNLGAATLTAIDHAIEFDFGAKGIGGNPSSTAGDGYYEIDVDLHGDGTLSPTAYFYRLLGDVNGDHIVDQADLGTITAALGQSGPNLAADVNGSGVVDGADTRLASQAKGHKLASGLKLGVVS
jgi:hypothetical protein